MSSYKEHFQRRLTDVDKRLAELKELVDDSTWSIYQVLKRTPGQKKTAPMKTRDETIEEMRKTNRNVKIAAILAVSVFWSMTVLIIGVVIHRLFF